METAPHIPTSSIRRQYDSVSHTWHYSIVDVIGAMVNTSNPRTYWKVLKNRLNKTHKQLVTDCNQLKMPASDGKYYLTDTADKGTLHEILYLISPESLPLLKRYLESLEEVAEDSSDFESPDLTSKNSAAEGYPQGDHFSPENVEKSEENNLRIDAYRDGDFIVIRTCAAGIDPENIFISATCTHLLIKGVRNDVIEDPHAASHFHQELHWGSFQRRFELPHEIDIHKVEAINRNGLIVIRLPIIDKEYARRIKIKKS